MMRRAMEDGSRAFGMAAHTGSPPGYPDVGTVMHIRSIQLLPDGRSLVDCFAAHSGERQRFRVLERSERDGYNVARVAWLVDADAGHELEGLVSSPALSSSWQSLKAFVGAVLAAVPDAELGALPPGWRARSAQALIAAGRGDAHPPPPAVAAVVEAGLVVVVAMLVRLGRPPSPPESDPQRWLWWLCVALPVSDARKYEWLATESWATRVASVAAAVSGLCDGSALSFVERIGAHVSARGLESCGVQ
jgi:hypothetical protein